MIRRGRRAAGCHRFGFSNAVMFQKVMSDAELCRRTAEVLLGIEIDHVEFHAVEERIDIYPDAHGVQLDAYLKADGRVIDIEMQACRVTALPRRLRFYQSLIDLREFERGCTSYSRLPDSAIVFICTFDPIGLGIPRYEIVPAIANAHARQVDAGMRWVLLNACAWQREESESLRNLLAYAINEGDVTDDPLVRDIDTAVADANANERWVRQNMDGLVDYWEMRRMDIEAWRDEARREYDRGRAEGEARGRAEGEAALAALTKKLEALGVDADLIKQASGA